MLMGGLGSGGAIVDIQGGNAKERVSILDFQRLASLKEVDCNTTELHFTYSSSTAVATNSL